MDLERSSIAERLKAGLRNAKAKDKWLGRPKAVLDAERIVALRAQGFGWKRIAADRLSSAYRFSLLWTVESVRRFANQLQ